MLEYCKIPGQALIALFTQVRREFFAFAQVKWGFCTMIHVYQKQILLKHVYQCEGMK